MDILTKLGQFNDLHSFNGEANRILIGWECSVREKDTKSVYSCNFSFDALGDSTNYDLSQLQPHLFSCEIKGQTLQGSISLISSRRSSKLNILQPSDLLKPPLSQENALRYLEYQVDIEGPIRELGQRGKRSRGIYWCWF